jgi:hypothetical protein
MATTPAMTSAQAFPRAFPRAIVLTEWEPMDYAFAPVGAVGVKTTGMVS